jgi:hypothetical protein
MNITFKLIGLAFGADVTVEDEYIEFRSLTHDGQDASFLAASTLVTDLEDAAFDTLAALEYQQDQDIAADRIADREAFGA